MSSLRVNFAGLKLPNPIILASASPGWNGEHLKRAAMAGAGAVIPKSLGSPSEWFNHPRNGRMVVLSRGKGLIGMQNIEIFSTQHLKRWLEGDLKVAKEGNVPLIISFVAQPDPADTMKLAKRIAATGQADLLELNVSCPMPARGVGWNIGRDPQLVAEQVKAVKEGVPDIPMMPKLTPNVADIGSIARAAEDAGADAIAGINSIRCLIGVDVETGRPLLRAFGGYTGPAIKPISLRCVAEISMSLKKIPVSGIGGVMNWRDAIEMMMVGAKTVQIATAVIWHGPSVFKAITTGIQKFMERNNYNSVEDFVGCALKYLTTTEEVAKEPAMVAKVDPEVCNACEKCIRICVYDAITMIKGKAMIDAKKCDGCGLCIQLCPEKAISLV